MSKIKPVKKKCANNFCKTNVTASTSPFCIRHFKKKQEQEARRKQLLTLFRPGVV